MPKLALRLVPDDGQSLMALFTIDARGLDNLQLAILSTPRLMSSEVVRHMADALKNCEVLQYEEHVAEIDPPMQLIPAGTLSKEEVEALGIVIPESPMKFTGQQIVIAAEAAHEANRAYCAEVLMDNSQLPWGKAPDWQRDSAIQGVEYAIRNNFPSPEAMHENWMKDKLAAGWVYGPVKNGDSTQGPLTHPSLRPYMELPEAERGKDSLFRTTIMESLGVKDQPVTMGTMKEFGAGEGPGILFGAGAEAIKIEEPKT